MPDDSTIIPPLYAFTDDDHAALVVVAALIFLVYAFLALGIKLTVRLGIASMKYHDSALIAAALFYVAQTTCVIFACNNGLGRHQSDLTPESFVRYSKLSYAAGILSLFVNAFTKIFLCCLIRHIDNEGRLNAANMTLLGIVVAWLISALFAAAFQCPLPQPWLAEEGETCPNRGPILMYSAIMNMLTDVALCVLPAAMMWHVHTTVKRKAIVVALFGCRIIVPVTLIPGLAHAGYLYQDNADITWLSVSSVIWFQISLGFSVLTACIPSLKGIIDSLLGSTAVAAIDAPYELQGSDRRPVSSGQPLQVSCRSNNDSRLRAKISRSALSRSNWSAERDMQSKYNVPESPTGSGRGSSSDSVRQLTDGVIVVETGLHIQYDYRTTTDVQPVSQGSLDMYN